MKLAIIGLSHATAPLELRERFAKATADRAAALSQLTRLPDVEEACLISTCNRVEFYVAGPGSPVGLAAKLKAHVQTISGLSLSELEPHLYVHHESAAIQHLFRVASALDSMVLGEPQILGQVKQAFRTADEAGTLGAVLRRVFQRAFHVAKRVRSETAVSENAVSMSFAAVELGKQIFERLDDKQVLLVGAGKMASLAAKHLRSAGVREVRVASRTMATAERLAEEIGGLASNLANLPMLLEHADIVISSTAAPGFVVDRKMMSKIMRARRFRNILFVDIAVPRDIDPAVGRLDNVFVYDVDDLKVVLQANQHEREKEAARAEALVASELAAYAEWSRSQQVVPVIKALRGAVSEVIQAEIERSLPHFSSNPRAERHLKKMGGAITNKLLHPVMQRLKAEGADGDPTELLALVGELFDLQLEHEGEAPQAESSDSDPGAQVLPLRARVG